MVRIENSPNIPGVLLLPLLWDLSRLGVAVDEVLDCPTGRVDLGRLTRGEIVDLGRADFLHANRVGTLKLEEAACRMPTRNSQRIKTLRLMLNLVVGADNLADACGKIADFNAILEDRGYPIRMVTLNGATNFIVGSAPSEAHPTLAIAFAHIVFYVNLFSWLTGSPLDLFYIGVPDLPAADEPSSQLPYHVPIFRREPETFLAFAADNLARKVVRTQGDVKAFLENVAFDPLFYSRISMPISGRVRSILREKVATNIRIPDGPGMARELRVSVSTLSRQLKAENTSFLRLKSECQRDAAKLFLRQGRLDMEQIAMRLGFFNVRSFRRAFLGWTGTLPSDFRRDLKR